MDLSWEKQEREIILQNLHNHDFNLYPIQDIDLAQFRLFIIIKQFDLPTSYYSTDTRTVCLTTPRVKALLRLRRNQQPPSQSSLLVLQQNKQSRDVFAQTFLYTCRHRY